MTQEQRARKRNSPAKQKRSEFIKWLNREYHKLIEKGVDPYNAKRRLAKRRRPLRSFFTPQQIDDMLYRKKRQSD